MPTKISRSKNTEQDDEIIITPTQVRQTALNLLARREHSYYELKQKLQQRNYPLELITEQLDRLKSQGLINETRFIENFVRSRTQKGYGPIRISAELHQRGISTELIEEFVNSTAEHWIELAKQACIKRFGKKIPKDFAERAKQVRFLQYRGFGFEQIKYISRDNLALDE